MSEICGVAECPHLVYAEGVCLYHYPLWETWGYEYNGYEIYSKQPRNYARQKFDFWLKKLRHQQIVDILTNYDWKLTQAVNESIESQQLRTDKK